LTENQLVDALVRDSLEYREDEPSVGLRQRFFGKLGGIRVLKTSSVLPEYVFNTGAKIRTPPADYVKIFDLYQRSWIMRQISRAIIGEVITPWIEILPRFKLKCKKCEREWQSTVDKCDCGSKRFAQPDYTQRQKLENLIDKPNSQYSFEEFLRSTLHYLIGLDDFYWYIGNKELLDRGSMRYIRQPKDVYVEDSRFIFPVSDEKGRLGNTQYFCPKCYDATPDVDNYEEISGWTKRRRVNPKCPKCRKPMTQTAYVQKANGKITGRFGEHEIVHGSMSRILPKLFGNPKMLSVWILVNILMVMDEYNYEVYSEGKVSAIIGFPEHDQNEITKMKKSMEKELRTLARTQLQTGKAIVSRRIRTVFIGLKKAPIRIPLMEDLKKMQSIEFYDKYAQKIAGVFGVTPEFVSMRFHGGLNRMEIDVQNHVTKEHQHVMERTWNDQVCPRFDITDWIIKFKNIEQKDELRESQILHTKAATALTFLQGGFDVEIDDNHELSVSGKGTPFPKQKTRELGGTPSRVQQPEDARMGAAMGVRGTKPETESQISPRTDAMVREAKSLDTTQFLRIPTSWYEATKVNILGQELAINDDQDEIFIEGNGNEIIGTRTDARNFNLAFSKLIDITTTMIHETYKDAPGFDSTTHESMRSYWVQELEREYNPRILIDMSNYYQNKNFDVIAKEIDNLRSRTEQIKLDSKIIQPV